ncbi:hypothetical protein PRK78_000934 [Emydomyces testavorans]|uniref:Uncharacterized protein n=1 Tax=Emydomyces testavorans TaxID=2070801 RepID=A0AAF0DC23_9EURO|nr:hypothetical protein PRK78_000934 [Emydomyces testavorans]
MEPCSTDPSAVQHGPSFDILLNNRIQDDDWVSLDADSPFSSQESISSCSSNASGAPALVTSSDIELSDQAVQCYTSLLDSGLRSFLCQQRFWLKSCIDDNDEKPPVLSNLASYVLNPDYHCAISQRASLIPIIAKGIHSLLSTTQSSTLKSKLDDLEKIYRNTYNLQSTNPTATPDQAVDTRTILKCLLWTTMQHGLYTPYPTCRLSPLNTDSISSNSTLTKATNLSSPLAEAKITTPARPLPTEQIPDDECLFTDEEEEDDETTDEEDLLKDLLEDDDHQFLNELLVSPTLPLSPMLDDDNNNNHHHHDPLSDQALESDLTMLDHPSHLPSESPTIPAPWTHSDPILDDDDDDGDGDEDDHTDIDMNIDVDSDIDISDSDSAHLSMHINQEMLF